jgi:hypothetical protein
MQVWQRVDQALWPFKGHLLIQTLLFYYRSFHSIQKLKQRHIEENEMIDSKIEEFVSTDDL